MTDYYKDSEPYIPTEPYGPRFNATDVRLHRDVHEVSFMSAKNDLMSRQILDDLRKGKCGHDVSTLYDILIYLAENRLLI